MLGFGGSPLPAILAALVLDAAAGSWADAREPSLTLAASGVPSDVMAFLRRKGACDRLSEDDEDSSGRLTEAVQMRLRLKCHLIQDDERRLRARYVDQPDIIALIERGDD